MYSIQPDWTLSSDFYKKRIVNTMGIAHFYEFRITSLSETLLPSVPDDCVDLVFDLDHGNAIAAGTVFERGSTWMKAGNLCFGMRFLPGVKPVILNGNFKEYNYLQVDLTSCCNDSFLAEQISELADFNERCNFFLDYYRQRMAGEENSLNCKEQIVSSVLKSISNKGGIVTIEDVVNETGYSARYIEKVFKTEMGLSPKKYSDILRFQGALDYIDKHPDQNICNVATDYGYYDQSAFVRVFKKNTGVTPAEYRKLIRQSDYQSRIRIM